MELLGHLERFAASIYPYRWFVFACVLVLIVSAGILARRRAWHLVLLRHKQVSAIVAVAILVVTIPIGYYLLSPLWTRTHLEEESPLAIAAQAMPADVAVAVPTAPVATATPESLPTVIQTTEPAAATVPAATATVVAVPDPAVEPTAPPAPQVEPTATIEIVPDSTPELEPTPEPVPTEFVPHVVLAGEFYGADDFHFGSGTALLIATAVDQAVLRLENFSVQNGPDLFVYLSTNPDGWSEDALNLGELRATDGSFNYDVPMGVDITQYQSVVIWCRAFAVLFSTAPLM